MSSKRALIVDDSRSARHILSRMLESFGLEVDAVESAELALTYLQTARPDVIFMDHLMPGMDGFAAVRVIKANPDTATIPVLMYTSQEGDMYLSQARALGAMGVLPKTLKHADVAEALQHLNLHTPIPTVSPRAAPPVRVATSASTLAPTMASELAHREPVVSADSVTAPVISAPPEHVLSSNLSVPQLAHRIASEVNAQLQRADSDTDRGSVWRVWALLASCLALLLLAVVIYQQNQIQQQLSQLQSLQPAVDLHAASSSAAGVASAVPPATLTAATSSVAPTWPVEIEEVSYGEVPLSGARLEHLRNLVDKMHAQRLKGVIRVEVFFGDFCLTGSAATGYMVAADELLMSRCDLVGNPFGDGLTVQQRQSVSFANLVASINSDSSSGIKVQLVDGAHQALTVYPALASSLTVATWNRIAQRNQRVEFTVLAAQ